MRKYSVEYIDRHLNGETYHDLVEVASTITSSSNYSPRSPDYGLAGFAFLLVESLKWFAMGWRSGICTYYECTPPNRQILMLELIRASAPEGFADFYQRGMDHWRDEHEMLAVDKWLIANDDAFHEWLRRMARENREAILGMT